MSVTVGPVVGENIDANIGAHVGGKVKIDILDIKTVYGEIVTLLGSFRELLIFENIFSSSIYGTISILDKSGMLEKHLFSGGEEIEFKILKPKTNQLILWRKDLIVHKISKATMKDDLSSSFIIYFTTKAFINASKKRVFKSFKNITFYNAIQNLYSETSPNGILIDNPGLSFDEPYVCPGLNPHSAIDYMAKMACSKNKFYVFFERASPFTFNGADNVRDAASHYFGSVENLIGSPGNDVYTITYREKTTGLIEPDLGSNIIRTSSFSRLANFNHIEAMLSGAYNSKVTTIDPIQKTWDIVKNSYITKNVIGDFYSNPVIAGSVLFSKYDDTKYEFPGERLLTTTKSAKYSKNKWLTNYMYGYLSKNIFKVETIIEGGTNNIGTGTVINLNVPSHYGKLANPENPQITNDIFYSGKYLVTAVKHEITLENYIKTLELSRGSSPVNLGATTLAKESSKTIVTAVNRIVKPFTIFSRRRFSNLLNRTVDVKISQTPVSITRNADGVLNSNSIAIVNALGIELSGSLLTERSYKVLAQAIKNGEFVNLNDAIYVTYPGNIRRLSGTDAAIIRSKIQENL